MRAHISALILIALLVAVGTLSVCWRRTTPSLAFVRMPVPEGIAGDCKAVGDLDGDGMLDVIVGGKGPGEPLLWYQHGSWVARQVGVSVEEFSNDCAVADVNRDGFPDIVVPDATVGPENLFWFENPGPKAALTASSWKRHPIGHTIAWCKDVRVVDLDADGLLDVLARPQFLPPVLFFQAEDGSWTRVELVGAVTGQEGMGAGDLDGDGDTDIVIRGAWLENPGGHRSRLAEEWTTHSLGEAPENFKALVADIDADGVQDVLFSSSETEAPVVWWGRADSASNRWMGHVVAKSAKAAHTLWAVDLDRDEDLDIVTAELVEPRITWHANLDGHGEKWDAETIETERGSIHNGVIADLDRDGDLDIFGAGFTGQPTKASVWWNQLNPTQLSIGPFSASEVTDRHVRALGLVITDVDRDGLADIAAGPYWYRNPGGDMSEAWQQHTLPLGGGQPVDVIAALPVDGEMRGLVSMTPDAGLWWLKPENGRLRSVRVGEVPEADHGLSSQGVEVAQLQPGGPTELVLSNGGETATGVGVYAFTLVPHGPWPRRRISARTSDEGIAVGDIDRDGDLDVVGTRGDLGEVEWYVNPGDSREDWPARRIANLPDIRWLDRVRVSDLNCDGRLDVVVTEENGARDGAKTFWLEQPADLAQAAWPAHLVTSQGSTNSLDLADFDRDGDMDIVIGEHKGELKVAIWENTRCGAFKAHVVDSGKESHLGTKAADLDQDGDLDLVSIAWDEPRRIYLWRNDTARKEQGTSAGRSTKR